MSVQEDYLRGIADAIRDREGSSGTIPAADFAARIKALPRPRELASFSVTDNTALLPSVETYVCLSGMTFGEWIDSAGNTAEYTDLYGGISKLDGKLYCYIADETTREYVQRDSIIRTGGSYLLVKTSNPIG